MTSHVLSLLFEWLFTRFETFLDDYP